MKFEDAINFVRDEHGPSPGMLTNVAMRFILNLGAALACLVPLRLFHQNQELAGAAMVGAIAIMNFYYGIDSVIWPNDNIETWFKGYGWCDIQLVLWIPLETLNAAAICAVMHNIANQIFLMRASGLTAHEKKRKHIIQALIIFPVPALQAILYFFTIGRRYNISGIIGCQAVFQTNWVFLVFFILPCPIFAVAAAYFAALSWWRYRQIDDTCRRALYNSGNYGAQARSARARRKLYFMALTIVAPYCPMQLVFLFNNLRTGWPWSRMYDLAQLHAPGWDEIDYAPSSEVSFVSMYINYIAFLEVVVFFFYFGGTKDAHEMYRKDLRALGLGKIFPRLNEEWHPSDRPPTTFKALWPRAKNFSSFFTSTYPHSRSSSTHKAHTHFTEQPLSDIDDSNFLNMRLNSLDLERATATLDAARSSNRGAQRPYQGPTIFRDHPALRFQLPKMPRPAVFRSEAESSDDHPSQRSLASIVRQQHPRLPSSVLSRARSSNDKHSMNETLGENTVVADWSRASNVSGCTLVGDPSLRLSDYGRGLVNIKRDFASSYHKSDLMPSSKKGQVSG